MKLIKIFGMGMVLLGTFFLFACDNGGGSSDATATGTLALELADSSTDRYQAVYITVDEVHVKRTNDSSDDNNGWINVASPQKTYNLLNLVNGVTAVLGEEELVAGHYNQIRLMLGRTPESTNNIFGNPHPYACYVIMNDGDENTATIKQLKVPSGYQTGVKLVHQFEVLDGEVVELVLDFDACRSVVQASSGDKFILKPTIKVINTLEKSAVIGTVTDDSDPVEPIEGASVSAQISDQDSARVVRSTLTDVDGGFQLILSPDTSFNIVAYSGAKVGDQMYSPACAEIEVPFGEDVVLDQGFRLEKIDFGTVSGTVTVTTNNGVDLDHPPVVYVSFYALLSCGYVEITTLPVYPDADGNLEYSVDLPLDDYDAVASAEGFIPNTGQAALDTFSESAIVDLNITEQPGS